MEVSVNRNESKKKQKSGKRNIVNRFRRFSQALTLLVIGEFSFYGIFRCPFAIPYVSCANCPVIQCPGRKLVFPFWGGLAVLSLLFGRAFCGWGCPGGLISGILSRFVSLKRKLRSKFEGKYYMLKYGAAIVCLYVWIIMSNPRWAIPIRTGEFWKSVRLTFEHANGLWLTKTAALLGLIIMGGLLGNIWCRCLCPTGGILEVFRKVGLFQFRKTSDCNDCGLCRDVCEFDTEPDEVNCTNCGECLTECPKDAIYFGIKASAASSAKQRE